MERGRQSQASKEEEEEAEEEDGDGAEDAVLEGVGKMDEAALKQEREHLA